MASYEYAHSVETTASADAVWALWSDVTTWARWDGSVERVTLDGPFESGSTGTMIIPEQPPIAFTLTEVSPGKGFTDETQVPGGILRFRHELEALADGRLRVTHYVEIDGPRDMADEFGPMVTEDVPEAMRGLVRLAEAS